ncbi:MAG TPA: DUF4115 domain-containing protein [Rhodospirillales bacterium]|nr:DUF4115 domain-containing protein [Rhodospirillales bacterium]
MASPEQADISNKEGEQNSATGVGALLKASRLRIGDDLRQIANILKIRYVYLEAIEDGRFEDLPGHTYSMGFVRAYAEHLGLDSDEVIRRFKNQVVGEHPEPSLEFPEPFPEMGIPRGAIIFIGILVAAVAYGVWYVNTSKDGFIADLITPVPERMAEQAAGGGQPKEAAPEVVAKTEPKPEMPVVTPTETATVTATATATVTATETATETAAETPAPALETASTPEPSQAPETPVSPEPPITPEAMVPAETVAPTPEAAPEPVPVEIYSPELIAAPVEASPAPTPAPPVSTPAPEPVAPIETAATPEPAPAPEPAPTPEVAPTPVVPVDAPSAPSVVPMDMIPPAAPASTTATSTPASQPATDTQTAALPAAAPKAETTPASSGGQNRIVVRAKMNSWIQVRDDTVNELLVTRLLRAGDSYAVPDRSGLKLSTGNAGALEILVDGEAVPSIGGEGTVRRNVFLDADKLKAGTAAGE